MVRLVQNQSQEIDQLKLEIEYLIRKPVRQVPAGKRGGAVDSPIPNVESPMLPSQNYTNSNNSDAAMAAEPRSESAPAEQMKTSSEVVIPPANEEVLT